MNKRVIILFGGKSPEHEVSIMGARKIFKELSNSNFDLFLVGIDKKGKFRYLKEIPKEDSCDFEGINIIDIETLELLKSADIVIPILHGPFGEDGKIQGFLDTLDINYIGCNCIQSSLIMDKDFTKTILKANSIPVVDWIIIKKGEDIPNIEEYPVFVKPSNQGSSIGINKARNKKELLDSIKEAFKYDKKILIEKAINAREIECAILGDLVSGVGEVIPSNDFYDYNAKYFDDGKSRIIIPANIGNSISEKIREYTKKIAAIFDINTISRVDFFLEENGNIYLNEINTMPGHTDFSMYSLLFNEMGITSENILKKLISIAEESHD